MAAKRISLLIEGDDGRPSMLFAHHVFANCLSRLRNDGVRQFCGKAARGTFKSLNEVFISHLRLLAACGLGLFNRLHLLVLTALFILINLAARYKR